MLLYGDSDKVLKLRGNRTANGLAFHQNVVRFVAKLEFVTGVAFAVAESIGVTGFLHIQEKLGELLTQIDVIKALIIAAEAKAVPDAAGVLVPDLTYVETARSLGTKYYPRAVEILQQVGAGGFVQTPSGIEDFYGPISEFMHLYFEGAAVSAEKKWSYSSWLGISSAVRLAQDICYMKNFMQVIRSGARIPLHST
ncbi:hypothetical protein MT997_29270 [Paenibacillus sp. OVF10]|nr:hypothetical protein MT997_29270 [Paenibacillus sp. OVF10]